MRATRPKFAQLSDEQRKRANARAYANEYQRRGKLIPQPCEGCGAAEVQKHHRDYDRPLDVRWMCAACHVAMHARQARKWRT